MMERLVEYIADEQLLLGRITDQDSKKLTVTDPRGRASRVALDKVLFRHSGASYEEVAGRLEELQGEVDVQLLWETLLADEDLSAREAPELARIYFDDSSDAHSSAIFRALSADRLHFRRRGRTFEPRSTEELQRLQEQRQSEQQAQEELERLKNALSQMPLDQQLCQRIERHLRHGGDRPLAGILAQLSRTPERYAFDLLLQTGHFPPTADLEVIQANLRRRHPQSVIEHAASLTPVPGEAPVQPSAFTIDDPETREVDDALSICRDGDLLRVDIDIADVASLVAADDPVDQEALRRAVTVYLPTGTTFMLPEHLGCDLLSLRDGQPRPAMRTSAWLDSEGQIVRYQLQSTRIMVSRRLDYDTADQLLQSGEGPTAEALRLLDDVAGKLAARRRADGAFSFRQREWKIHVSADGEEITVKPLPHASPSRQMVAEMMILANRLAADYAAQNDLPIIYRIQSPPTETLPDVDPEDPFAFIKLKGRIKPATLSLQPAQHWGLGLDQYTQATSPLRRYADLVIQRQLHASLAGKPPPYSSDQLLRVLATAETTEREIKRVEAAVDYRWALEYVARLESTAGLEGWVLEKAPSGGYRFELEVCGAQGILQDRQPRQTGDRVRVDVKTVKPRQGVLRLLASSSR